MVHSMNSQYYRNLQQDFQHHHTLLLLTNDSEHLFEDIAQLLD